jgi:hypothetical protein
VEEYKGSHSRNICNFGIKDGQIFPKEKVHFFKKICVILRTPFRIILKEHGRLERILLFV